MNTTLKKFVSMFMIFSMVLAINTTAFAAEKNSDSYVNSASSISRASTLHKVNGVYSSGASTSYTTTTTRRCYEIRVKGTTYDSSTPKVVNVTVTNSSYKVVANIYNLKLDNKEYPLSLWDPFTGGFNAGNYTVTVTSSDNKAYDISTYIYY